MARWVRAAGPWGDCARQTRVEATNVKYIDLAISLPDPREYVLLGFAEQGIMMADG